MTSLTLPGLRRFQLRDSTKADHAAVDAAVGPLANLDSYRAYLQGQFVFRQSHEQLFSRTAWPVSLGEWRPAGIASLVADDIDAVGDAVPDVGPIAAVEPEDLWGVLYVVVGSNLGAQLLIRRLDSLGLSVTRGGRHLARQVSGLGDWKAFVTLLEGAPDFDLARNRASARAAFAAARAAFASRAPVLA